MNSFKDILEKKRKDTLDNIKRCVKYLKSKPGGAVQYYPDGNYVFNEEEYELYPAVIATKIKAIPVIRKYILLSDNELELVYNNLYQICFKVKETEYLNAKELEKRKIISTLLEIEMENI